MAKYLVILFIFFSISISAQISLPRPDLLSSYIPKDTTTIELDTFSNPEKYNSLEDMIAKSKEQINDTLATIDEYLIISNDDTIRIMDTTYSIHKEYRYNYIRKDRFELMPFANVGHTFNRLGYNFSEMPTLPQLGARGKHYAYKDVKDTYYYWVPTPVTEIFYKNVINRGQLSSAFFTTNISPQFNFSVGFKGLWSVGRYVNNQSDDASFYTTYTYKNKSDWVGSKLQYTSQTITNDENGGLTEMALNNFLSTESEFNDRARLDVNLNNAESELKGERFLYNNYINIIKNEKDSTNHHVVVGHKYHFENKRFKYDQEQASSFYGNTLLNNSRIIDSMNLETEKHSVYAKINYDKIGKLHIEATRLNYRYFFPIAQFRKDVTFPNKLNPSTTLLEVKWNKKITPKLDVKVNLFRTLDSVQYSHRYNGSLDYTLNEDMSINASFAQLSQSPNFNWQLYQSNYAMFNWVNENWEQQETNYASLSFEHKKWGKITATGQQISNYFYFKNSSETPLTNYLITQEQHTDSTINYLKVKYEGELVLLKKLHISLINTLQYQNVEGGEGVLHVPEIIARSTLAYTNWVADKAMYLQTGFNFKYFTSYFGDSYVPVIGEFASQNQLAIGGFPMFDFFFNGKIKTARIFIKMEFFNHDLGKPNFFSAPAYPFRDRVFRFGIVWNFFH